MPINTYRITQISVKKRDNWITCNVTHTSSRAPCNLGVPEDCCGLGLLGTNPPPSFLSEATLDPKREFLQPAQIRLWCEGKSFPRQHRLQKSRSKTWKCKITTWANDEWLLLFLVVPLPKKNPAQQKPPHGRILVIFCILLCWLAIENLWFGLYEKEDHAFTCSYMLLNQMLGSLQIHSHHQQ